MITWSANVRLSIIQLSGIDLEKVINLFLDHLKLIFLLKPYGKGYRIELDNGIKSVMIGCEIIVVSSTYLTHLAYGLVWKISLTYRI